MAAGPESDCHRVDVARARLSVQRSGAVTAPALLLLPGQASDHRWWTRLRTDFEDSFSTVTFDYRGTGATELARDADEHDEDWSTAAFADDAAAVVRALGLTSVHVYGTSMGGRVAQQFAVRHPELLGRLVLAATSPGGPAAVERGADVRRALAQPDPALRRHALFDLFYSPAWIADNGGYDHAPSDLFGDADMSRAARHRHLLVSARHDAAGELHRITAPTLVLHGSADRMVPASNSALLSEGIRGSRLREFPGGRHGFFDEFRDDVAPLITEHLLH